MTVWIFYRTGFVSIVADRNNNHRLLCRFRVQADAEAFSQLVADANGYKHRPKVIETEFADYRYRITAGCQPIARTVLHLVMSIDYDNFKNACHGEPARDRAMMQVWSSMLALQPRRPLPIARGSAFFDDDPLFPYTTTTPQVTHTRNRWGQDWPPLERDWPDVPDEDHENDEAPDHADILESFDGIGEITVVDEEIPVEDWPDLSYNKGKDSPQLRRKPRRKKPS